MIIIKYIETDNVSMIEHLLDIDTIKSKIRELGGKFLHKRKTVTHSKSITTGIDFELPKEVDVNNIKW